MITILLLCLALLVPVQQTDQFKQQVSGFRNKSKFSTNYDKFVDTTTVSVGPFFIGNSKRRLRSATELNMSARFTYPGKTLDRAPDGFSLVFRAYGSEWEFLDNRRLYALIDGERIDLGDGTHDGDVRRSGYVSEYIVFEVPAEVFQKLAQGRSAELRIGNFEMVLKAEHSEAFRNLYTLSLPKKT